MTEIRSTLDRFFAKVNKTETCWLWTGCINKAKGYGRFWDGERTRGAHRVGYELLRGPVPPGLHLDHLCRVRHCVNPDHLEPVTVRENLLRGETSTARYAARTHCDNGHEFTPENTVKHWHNGSRRCRTCRTEAYRRQYAAKKARTA